MPRTFMLLKFYMTLILGPTLHFLKMVATYWSSSSIHTATFHGQLKKLLDLLTMNTWPSCLIRVTTSYMEGLTWIFTMQTMGSSFNICDSIYSRSLVDFTSLEYLSWWTQTTKLSHTHTKVGIITSSSLKHFLLKPKGMQYGQKNYRVLQNLQFITLLLEYVIKMLFTGLNQSQS